MVITDERCGPLVFSSNFDSGNLASVEQVIKTDDTDALEQSYSDLNDVDLEYRLWTSPDASGTFRENGNRTWFHFSVRGPLSSKTVRFHVMNMNKQCKLYAQGMSPVFRTLPGKNTSWKRIKDKPTFMFSDGQFILTFTHYFIDVSRYAATYFAFCYPFSYDECQNYLHEMEMKYCTQEAVTDIYFHRDTLCYSVDGLKIDLLTVSSTKGLQNKHEETLVNLFPDQNKKRARQFRNKKIFFLTSRVHPGETPSSFVFNGFLDFILRESDPRSMMLRDTFVFKLIPMLNPDGVKRGHYRTDALGVNLNRVYLNPDLILHPSIYAVKEIMLYHHFDSYQNKKDISLLHNKMHHRTKSHPIIIRSLVHHADLRKSKSVPDVSVNSSSYNEVFFNENSINADNTNFSPCDGNVAIFVDLHGHASKRGCFMYGNYFEREKDLVECMLFPKLISMNSSHFDFQGCNFSEKNMYHIDRRDGLSKAGSGRVAMFKSLGIIHSYTLECNYNTGQSTNPIAAAMCDDGRATPPPLPGFPPRYTPEHYAEVGRGMAVAVLDFFQKNPWSRLPLSDLKSLTGVREWLSKFIRNSFKATSGSSKRKTVPSKCNRKSTDKSSKISIGVNFKPVSRQSTRPTPTGSKIANPSKKVLRPESFCVKASRNTTNDDGYNDNDNNNVTVYNVTVDDQEKTRLTNETPTVITKGKKTPLYFLQKYTQCAPSPKPMQNHLIGERQLSIEKKQVDNRRENNEQNSSERKPVLLKKPNALKRTPLVMNHTKVSPNSRKISPNHISKSGRRKAASNSSPAVTRKGVNQSINSPKDKKKPFKNSRKSSK